MARLQRVASRPDASSRPHHFAITPADCSTTTQQRINSYTRIMAEIVEDVQMDMQEIEQEIEQETPPEDIFMAPSIHKADDLAGKSYSHFSDIPKQIADDMSKEVVLGVDEAGRGPVLGMSSLSRPVTAAQRLTTPQVQWYTPSSTCPSSCTTRFWPTHTTLTTPKS
jgi:hypothetical protein